MFPIFEYCCPNCVCKPFQSKAIGLSDSYHNLASLTKVKQNLWTLTPFGNAWVSIQSFVLRRCVSTSSSGFPVNSGLKWDQFNCGIGPGCTGGAAGCPGGTAVCVVGSGSTAGSGGASGGGCGILHQPFLFMSCVGMNIYITRKWYPNPEPTLN